MPPATTGRRALRRGLAVAVAAVVLPTTALAAAASAHGPVIDPMSRNHGCWKRWGSDFQNPTMATVDPVPARPPLRPPACPPARRPAR